MKLGGVLIVGLLLGLMGGLIYTWFVVPVQYYDTYPPLLSQRHRQEWIRMASWTYGLEGNWERTQTRLLHLPQSEIQESALEVLEEAVAIGQTTEVLQRLARLAAEHGASGPGVAIYAGMSPGTAVAVPTTAPLPTITAFPTSSPTPTPTAPPAPTATLVPAQASPFSIITHTLTCEPEPRIAVSLEISRTVIERGRERSETIGLPNRELWLIWDSGADRAITGFRPELSLGYADFAVEPGHTYNLYIDAPIGLPVLTLRIEPCTGNREGWVSRLLTVREIQAPDDELPPEEGPVATAPATSPTTTATVTPTRSATTPLAPVREE
jgi:hypothetical protein